MDLNKVLFEPLHAKRIVEDSMMNFKPTQTSFSKEEMYCVEILEDEEITKNRCQEDEVLLNEFIDVDLLGNFHATGMGTNAIFIEDQPISWIVKEKVKVANVGCNQEPKL